VKNCQKKIESTEASPSTSTSSELVKVTAKSPPPSPPTGLQIEQQIGIKIKSINQNRGSFLPPSKALKFMQNFPENFNRLLSQSRRNKTD
jgi:hypothetical protein